MVKSTDTRLAAYLARIGLDEAPMPGAAGLAILQRAHRLAIGFENFDVILGRAIGIDSDSVFAKLVTSQRGGYCFQHNCLFGEMLAALGMPSRPLLARVRLGLPADIPASETPPRTHTLRLVDLEGASWIADAGFGASYVPPLPLVDGATAATADGTTHRLRQIGPPGTLAGEWLLERAGPASATDGRAAPHADWQAQYSFDLAEVAPADLEQAHHWTSTRPDTRFTIHHIASIVLEDGFASLNGRRLSMHHGGRGDVMEICDAQDYRRVLADLFRIELTQDEVTALGLFPIGA